MRITPWGSILFAEEAGSDPKSATWELVDPLSVTGVTLDRNAGTSPNANIGRVNAFGFLSFEGFAILPNGVTYYGDELGPTNGTPGGKFYKFVPSPLYSGGAPITSLAQSPLKSGTMTSAGNVYGLRVSQGSNYGQGMAYGVGSWQPIAGAAGAALRTLPAAVNAQLTGYYRPEDLDLDTSALQAGNVRFCGPNTGRDEARYWGETVCFTDGTISQAGLSTGVPQVQLFVQGASELNMPDNIAYQTSRGNWLIEEDGSTDAHVDGARNNDIWDCLPDGADFDTLSDGCIRIATVNDFQAETTGGFFDASGAHYYVSIQHNSSGRATVLDVTGWGSQG